MVEVRVVSPSSQSLEPLEGRVIADPAAGDAEPVVSALDGDGTATLDLAKGTAWRVCLEAERLWSRCSIVAVETGDGPQPVRLEAWPRGYLVGELRLAEAGEALPDRVSITVQTPPRPGRIQGVPETSRLCEMQGEDQFRCPVPATVLDVTIRAPSFVAHDFWSVSASAGSDRALGTLDLRKGASLTVGSR